MSRSVSNWANNFLKPLIRHAHPLLMPTSVLCLVLICTFLIYAPGLDGTFLFDDEPNITTNDKIRIASLSFDELWHAAFSMDLGPGLLKRPISRLSFGLNYYLFGLDPYIFKLINLLVHLLNGVSLFLCLWLLINLYHKRQGIVSPPQAMWLSLAVSTVWLLHPLNLTTVLYVVQRMNGMAAFFSFWTITLYLWGRRGQLEGDRGLPWIIASLTVTMPLAVLSKENALILPVILFLIEWALFRFQTQTHSQRRMLKGLFLLVLAIPGALIVSFLFAHPNWLLESYANRTFTLYERLLTESRVLWFYISLVILPIPSKLGLYHDDFQISHGILEPPLTVLALLALVVLIVLVVILRRRLPILSFGVLFFFLGHTMESTIISLEIAHEHRNYFPIAGLLLIIVYYAFSLFSRVTLRNTVWAVGLLWVSYLGFVTAIRSDYWGKPAEHVLITAAYHPGSARANYEAGRFYYSLIRQAKTDAQRQAFYSKALDYFTHSSKADKYYTGGLLGVIWLDAYLNKSMDEGVLTDLQHRLEHAPMASMTATNLQRLNHCQMAGECNVSSEVMNLLLSASMRNTTVPERERAMLLSERMNRALVQGDMARALVYSQQAVSHNPTNVQHQLNMIHLLIVNNRIDEAKLALDKIAYLDLSEKEKQRLRTQEILLLGQREERAPSEQRIRIEAK